MNLDIHQIILNYLYDLKDQINIYNLDKTHQAYIQLYDLCDIDNKYKYRFIKNYNDDGDGDLGSNVHSYDLRRFYYSLRKKLITHQVLEQKKFRYIKKLDATYNKYVININHLIYLEKLYCDGSNCGINQKQIEEINLKILRASSNEKIVNVNHMKNLEILHCDNICGIDQNGIINLTNLKKLFARGNEKIFDVNYLIKLEILHCDNICGIDQNGISKLTNLKVLNMHDNSKIIDLNHLNKLKVLDCGGLQSKLGQNGIINLTNLIEIYLNNNSLINDLNHMHKLEKLNSSKFIEQKGIQNLINLKYIYISQNEKITDLNHMKNLEQLNCDGICGVSNDSICNLTNLRKISARGNIKINNLNHLINLEKIYLSLCNSCQTKIKEKIYHKNPIKLKDIEKLTLDNLCVPCRFDLVRLFNLIQSYENYNSKILTIKLNYLYLHLI